MKVFDRTNQRITALFIKNSQDTLNNQVRIRYGLLAGWISVVFIFVMFLIKLILGLRSDSISLIANAFHLLSHLANSIILIVSFKVTARPATEKNPFGHGRMEHIAPLIMSIFLFVAGIQLAEISLHQVLEPHEVHYWPALIWILLVTIIIKQFLGQFVRFLGNRVDSHAIKSNAVHHYIEAVMSLAVIGGLIAGYHFHHPEIDGILGILVSLWLLYLGFNHGKEALVPLMGQAPSPDLIRNIRNKALSVEGIEGVHEIIVHDYGSKYSISMHVEIPEKFGPAQMHEITEICEGKLRKTFGGEVVCHTDPLMEKSPEIRAIEEKFESTIREFPRIVAYHDFRIVAHSKDQILIVADIDVQQEVPETEFGGIAKKLESRVIKKIPNVLYCSFYITPKYAY